MTCLWHTKYFFSFIVFLTIIKYSWDKYDQQGQKSDLVGFRKSKCKLSTHERGCEAFCHKSNKELE